MVLLKRGSRIHAVAPDPLTRRRIDDRTRGIGGTITTVGAGGENGQLRRGASSFFQTQPGRKRELLTPPTRRVRAVEMYRRFPAPDDAVRGGAGSTQQAFSELPSRRCGITGERSGYDFDPRAQLLG